MSLVSIVVPVYHNEGSLTPLLEALQQLAARNADDRFEFVFVDDGSKDGSFALSERLAAVDPRLRVVRLSRNFGSNAAILAGLTVAKGNVVGVIAADLQDPPETFDEMLSLWRGGRKVVIAARTNRDDPPLTVFFAETFYRLFRRYAIPSMPPHGFDFFLIDRVVCDLITSIQENNAYLMGLVLWLGFDPATVHYERRARPEKYGHSMWTAARKLKYFIDAFVAFSHFPIRAASLLGIALSVVGVVYAVVLILLRLTYHIEVQGWTSLMVALLIVSGAQMMMLGVIGEYLTRTLDETRRRPRFIIDRIVDADHS